MEKLPRIRDMVGEIFHRLTVVEAAGSDNHQKRIWRCVCECGKEIVASTGALRKGNTKSCGCWKNEQLAKRRRTHGLCQTAEYVAWCAMKQRCYYEPNKAFHHYNGRGIGVCDGWLESFETFLADMGNKPSSKHSIERIDNDLGYNCGRCEQCMANGMEPNCRWATQTEQCRNKRSNRLITFNGETLSLAEWAERTGVRSHTLYSRLDRGWSVEQALKLPKQHRWSRRPKPTAQSHR